MAKIVEPSREVVHDGQEEFFLPSSETRVLQNEMLLGKILNFAVKNKVKVDMRTANHCKLVNTLWLDRTCVALRQLERPTACLNTKDVDKTIKFKNTFRHSPADRIPPFDLTIAPHHINFNWTFTSEQLEASLECLTHEMGERLASLNFISACGSWGEDDGAYLRFVPLILPNLQKIDLCEGHWRRGYDGPDKMYRMLIRKILEAGKHCKLLAMSLIVDVLNDELNIENMDIANSLQEIRFTKYCSYRSFHQLNNLFSLNARFPNLTCLSISVVSLKELGLKNKLFQILNSFRHQLKKLDMCNRNSECETIQVPVMECLEELVSTDWACERPNEATPILPTLFPMLRKFSCSTHYFYDALLSWVEMDGRSPSVINADLCLVTSRGEKDRLDQVLTEKICRFHTTFSNVTQLQLELEGSDEMPVMRYICENMNLLQKLEVNIFYHVTSDLSVDSLNAALLGITQEEVVNLRRTPEIWTDIQGRYGWRPSIINLTDLQKLYFSSGPHLTTEYYLDVAWKFGISRMTSLVDFSSTGKILLKV